MHRFFVSPNAFAKQPVTLIGEQARQIRRVLRLRVGARVSLLDGDGLQYEAVIVGFGEEQVELEVASRSVASGEPATRLSLYQAALKGDRFEWVLQKGTEIGVSRFVPIVCERNIVTDLDAIHEKRTRWQRIIREAAEQCGRARLPELASGQSFQSAVALQGERSDAGQEPLRLIAWEEEREISIRSLLRQCNLSAEARINIMVGPEGGFTRAEVEFARRQGYRTVSLAPRILRAETAGIVAATILLYEAKDL